MKAILTHIAKKVKRTLLDLLPIIVVVAFFQLFVIRLPLPHVGEVVYGSLLVAAGLLLFIEGLEMSLFPIGENMANALARKGSLAWLLLFGFLLGFSTAIAEPALIAVAEEAGNIAVIAGLLPDDGDTVRRYTLGLRICVAVSVGLAIFIGVIRILKGWPLYYLVIGGYLLIMAMTYISPKEIIGLAYDIGGVTTSTVTVPLVTALGVGLAKTIQGRSPLLDGFGMIALAAMAPIVSILMYGMFWFGK
ncbi:MAG: DUF1538 domain-containing protein [Lunatimonas sp.]|uniref:DUF1538 domain-containing protein n=1 Tax=Lunatimonas sp. TaxID=2060141 RepID=UPI00263B6F01|nr:DUF1538 domain-containing protein [Lunatimonas sp.]MCC5937268.1 DUF1538 domain-containing protein [Lunatimonas sp.]